MLNKLLLLLIFILNINCEINLQLPCLNLIQRKEIRQLNSNELQRYQAALTKLYEQGILNKYSKIHLDYTSTSHSVPAFLPWHRVFLRQFEIELQAIDSNIILPYWDWTIDSQSPEKSPILSSSYFGSNGQGPNKCIQDGFIKGWNVTVPDFHCLKRDYDMGSKISAFYSAEAIELIIRGAKTYNEFQELLEEGPHAKVHDAIGGDQGDLSAMFSPNDPLFYLHHAFIDLLWYEWQIRNPHLEKSYSGKIEDVLLPFNINVNDVFLINNNGFCYTYPRFNTVIPIIQDTQRNPPIEENTPKNVQVPITEKENTGPIFNPTENWTTPKPVTTKISQINPTPIPNPQITKSKPKGLFGNLLNNIAPQVVNSAINTLPSPKITLQNTLLHIPAIIPGITPMLKVSFDDRSNNNRNKIREIKPISEKTIIRFGLNRERVRKLENEINGITAAMNMINNFIPKASLL